MWLKYCCCGVKQKLKKKHQSTELLPIRWVNLCRYNICDSVFQEVLLFPAMKPDDPNRQADDSEKKENS